LFLHVVQDPDFEPEPEPAEPDPVAAPEQPKISKRTGQTLERSVSTIGSFEPDKQAEIPWPWKALFSVVSFFFCGYLVYIKGFGEGRVLGCR
jgi:hypothetical protein